MKPEQYKALKAIAYQSFESPQAGLHTLVKSDNNFVRFVERRSRLKYYEQGGDFFMTANEKYFSDWLYRRFDLLLPLQLPQRC